MNHPARPTSRFLWAVSPPLVRGVGKAFFWLESEFEARLPAAPYVVAANHYSHFDPPAVGAVLGEPVRFLALEDIFGVSRLLDWLVIGYGSIPVPRDRHPVGTVRSALAALDRGESVGVFPESTRVSHWGTVPAKRGAAWLAIERKVPLVPVAVIGTGRAFGLENRVQRAPIKVIVGKAMEPEGSDVDRLTGRWADWIERRVSAHPGSEVSGPRRAFHTGP
jgi:1-acyl-sn-glycerol-3-phosphate acyltransferase